jgi:hypothetical protein
VQRENIWTEDEKDGLVKVGFTRRFIDNVLMECFHIVQADIKNLYEGGPMLVVETNDGLESIKSPYTGTVHYFNPKARNFPDRLTEEDTIMTILPKGIVLPERKKAAVKKEPEPTAQGFNQWVNFPLDQELDIERMREMDQAIPVPPAPQLQPNFEANADWARRVLNQARQRNRQG